MSSAPTPSGPPAPTAPAEPEPLGRRRSVLLVLVALLAVAFVVALVVLRGVLDRVVADDSVEIADSVAIDLPDCRDDFPDWIAGLIEAESPRLVQTYGQSPIGSAGYRHPEGFPTAAFGWSGVQPTCGTTLVLPDGTGVAYYVDAAESSRTQFEAVSSMLAALGYVMTTDDVARDKLELDDDATPAPTAPLDGGSATDGPGDDGAAPDDAASESAYRVFRLTDGPRLWIQFDPFDDADPEGPGDLFFGYPPAA